MAQQVGAISVNDMAYYQLPNIYEDPPNPTSAQLQLCESKNSKIAQIDNARNTDIDEHKQYGMDKQDNSWKQTVEILQKRLDLALEMKKKALNDSKMLKNEIKKQDEKILALKESRNKLQALEVRYKQIISENEQLRKDIAKTNMELQQARNDIFNI